MLFQAYLDSLFSSLLFSSTQTCRLADSNCPRNAQTGFAKLIDLFREGESGEICSSSKMNCSIHQVSVASILSWLNLTSKLLSWQLREANHINVVGFVVGTDSIVNFIFYCFLKRLCFNLLLYFRNEKNQRNF